MDNKPAFYPTCLRALPLHRWYAFPIIQQAYLHTFIPSTITQAPPVSDEETINGEWRVLKYPEERYASLPLALASRNTTFWTNCRNKVNACFSASSTPSLPRTSQYLTWKSGTHRQRQLEKGYGRFTITSVADDNLL